MNIQPKYEHWLFFFHTPMIAYAVNLEYHLSPLLITIYTTFVILIMVVYFFFFGKFKKKKYDWKSKVFETILLFIIGFLITFRGIIDFNKNKIAGFLSYYDISLKIELIYITCLAGFYVVTIYFVWKSIEIKE